MSRPLSLFLLWLGCTLCLGDIYIHNPRGSNNRQDEGTRQRANANRVFDSQNNNRGGHNSGSEEYQGKMYFYAGSKLLIQWANQHSCRDPNNNCNIVIQYMCDDDLRDGTTTETIPVDKTLCENEDCDTDKSFGHHESLTYYEKCATRERNKGLFVANTQDDMGDSAQSTRQNNGGTRRGYECPEEKDYYPYFGDSPWKDIAVLTEDDCSYYQTQSQNVKAKFGCDFPDEYWEAVKGTVVDENDQATVLLPHNNKTQCLLTTATVDGTTYTAVWKRYKPHRIPAPDCLFPPWSRDNHQGNTYGGEFLSYWWTVPDIEEDHCTLRVRYNISTNDFDSWNTDHTDNTETGPSIIWERFGFADVAEAEDRGYIYKNDPRLDVFDVNNFKLRININVNQFGRTFQDRTHSFAIRRRHESFGDATIYNINVRGKRGNIVQVYPTTEYDFVPNILEANSGDYVHFQWTGSDNNPGGNAGQGRARTDRHNVVPLSLRPYAEGDVDINHNLTLGTNYPRDFDKAKFLGFCSYRTSKLASTLNLLYGEDPGPTLDDVGPYFDAEPALLKTPGTFHYFSTRNNAFSNRNEKATIQVN